MKYITKQNLFFIKGMENSIKGMENINIPKKAKTTCEIQLPELQITRFFIDTNGKKQGYCFPQEIKPFEMQILQFIKTYLVIYKKENTNENSEIENEQIRNQQENEQIRNQQNLILEKFSQFLNINEDNYKNIFDKIFNVPTQEDQELTAKKLKDLDKSTLLNYASEQDIVFLNSLDYVMNVNFLYQILNNAYELMSLYIMINERSQIKENFIFNEIKVPFYDYIKLLIKYEASFFRILMQTFTDGKENNSFFLDKFLSIQDVLRKFLNQDIILYNE